MAKKGKATKQTILMLTPETHLRLKVLATCSKKTMGEFIKFLMDRFEHGKPYTVEDDLKFLKHLEAQAKEAEAKARTVVDELEIQEAR